MKISRAHLILMLKEAGAGPDPLGPTPWHSAPDQVWNNLELMYEAPDLRETNLTNLDLSHARLRNSTSPGPTCPTPTWLTQ